jgi:hypothetical protein
MEDGLTGGGPVIDQSPRDESFDELLAAVGRRTMGPKDGTASILGAPFDRSAGHVRSRFDRLPAIRQTMT